MGKPLEVNDHLDGFNLLKEVQPERKNKVVGFLNNGVLKGLQEQVEEGEIKFLYPEDEESLELLRHSTSHLLAEAVQNLYPTAKFGFGPAIKEGFYYDIDFGDHKLTEDDLKKIEDEMKKLVKESQNFKKRDVSNSEAREIFKDNPYKLELINEHQDEQISIYTQGNFTDLCKGPHLPSTSFIKHFKLLSLAGAYWRGDSNNKQLTRIYGTSFFTEEDLKKHLEVLEQRKKNDHRLLGKELGLFFISDYGPGMPFFLPNGMKLKNALLAYWHKVHERYGYQEIETPTILSKELWKISGHWDHYKDNMYTTEIEGKEYAIKPMNCPGALLVYKNSLHSYRDFPLRYAELGHVHRYEASGALNGLFRVRAFTQDDSHIFITENQIEDEVGEIMKLFDEVYKVFNLKYSIVLSTRPEKDYIGTVEFWDKAEKALANACHKNGKEFKINPGDGAFYGPKLDFKLLDSLGRTWQCGTIQLDLNLPRRFDCTYVDENGEKQYPIMLHRVVFGSIERFIGIITENFGGVFPTWLAPNQVAILPVNDKVHGEYSHKVFKLLQDNDIRPLLDESEEKLGYRLRKAASQKIPYTLVIGDKEVQDNTVTYRKRGSQEQKTVPLDSFVSMIREEIKELK